MRDCNLKKGKSYIKNDNFVLSFFLSNFQAINF